MKLIGIVVVVAVFLTGHFVAGAPAEQLCSTDICKQSAKYILDGMNTTAEPCDDFYEFACGGWKVHHQIEESRTRAGTFDALNDRMQKQLRALLAGETKATLGTANSVTYAGHLYHSCLNAANHSLADGVRMVNEVLQAITGSAWTIGQSSGGESTQSWNDHFVRAYAHGSMSPIFSVGIGTDPKNVTSKIVNIYPGGLGLGLKDLQNLTSNPKLVAAYKEYISSNAKLFCEHNCGQLDKDIDDIVHFESELAKVRMPIEEARNPDKTYNVLTLKQLSDQTKFDWLAQLFVPTLKLLGFNTTMNEQSTVRVGDLQYVIKGMDVVRHTPVRVIANYIGLKVVSGYGARASEHFRQISFEFNKVSSGVQKLSDREESCFGLSNSLLSLAISRMFIDHSFSSKEKTEAVQLVESIQASYSELVQHNQWLDSTTKAESLNKLAHVRKNVAYPEWLLNNTELDEYYVMDKHQVAEQLLTEKNYLLGIVRFYINDLKNDLANFRKPVNQTKNWPMPPAIINAAYSPTQNSITIPAGILKFPFFSAERPFAINYGFIGVVIGHEFTHGLDDSGRKYDYKGNLHNWWTAEDVQRFANRSQCFVDQYGQSVDSLTGLNLNGRNTLGENIADNGGLHESYNAFQKRQSTSGASPRLADLDKYSPEQLFFISYANTWCGLIRPQALKRQIEYDPHSPGQFRVNIPLSNSAEFSKAFSCPVGSKMNPVHKCQVW